MTQTLEMTPEMRVHLMEKTHKDDRGRWCCNAVASDGTWHLGAGLTYEQAMQQAFERLMDYERLIAQPPREQLLEILSTTKSGQLCSTPMERCVRLLAEELLKTRAVWGPES